MAIIKAGHARVMEISAMKRISTMVLIVYAVAGLFQGVCVYAGQLLITEVACGTKGDDWAEVFFQGAPGERIDIARLYVTMYYGANEPLSDSPITLHGADRPETPYDDRYAVIHLNGRGRADETDLTGDTDRNGAIDVYCENHADSLWNTDCVVAIDTDDDPANGGIVDFVAYSNRDGSVNATMAGYVAQAQIHAQWAACSEENLQQCMADVGADGLAAHQSLARVPGADTNSAADFRITPYQTPGRDNVFDTGKKPGGIFEVEKGTITIIPTHPTLGTGKIAIMVHEPCALRLRVFNAIGMLVHESPLYRDVNPGPFSFTWDLTGRGRPVCTGLYFGHIEGSHYASRRSVSRTVYIVVSRYR